MTDRHAQDPHDPHDPQARQDPQDRQDPLGPGAPRATGDTRAGRGSRAAVLGRIRAALADIPAEESPEQVPVPREYLRSHAGSDIVGLFAERVGDYRAGVSVTEAGQAASVIAELLTRRGVTSLVVPDGFPEALLPQGPWTVLREPLSVPELEGADGVLTTSAVGIAVTGTVVLDAGPGQGRRSLTLLPDYHLCVVAAGQVAGDVPEALSRLDPARPLTFVSGPSATSDIELDRVEGVHGPRTLDVVIVREPADRTP